jgi:DNA-binding IclR family transcriptional regulator
MPFDDRSPGTPPLTTLDRAFLVLDAFGPADDGLTLAELTRRTQVPKPTVLRIARALVGWGALERSAAGYRLGHRLIELGGQARGQQRLRDLALPFMSDLYGLTHGAVHLAVLDGTRTLILEKIAGPDSVPVASMPGRCGPAHCTGLGKVLLAFSPGDTVDQVIAAGLTRRTPHTIARPSALRAQLAEVRRTGIGFEREESTEGVACLAAPVFTKQRALAGAISVACPVGAPQLHRTGPAVRNLAAALSRVVATRL